MYLKIIYAILFGIILNGISSLKAQVVIGDNAQNARPHPKALLSFTSTHMGIILPMINSATETASSNNIVQMPGALFVSGANKQVKAFMATSPHNESGIINLTIPISTAVSSSSATETSQRLGVVIGNPNTTQTGILVLEDDEKTLVLPVLGNSDEPPHQYIKNPYIGTIGFSDVKNALYPQKPTKKFMWVYGGTPSGTAGNWHLWRSGVEMPPAATLVTQSYFDNLP